jgi:hypothetical protein
MGKASCEAAVDRGTAAHPSTRHAAKTTTVFTAERRPEPSRTNCGLVHLGGAVCRNWSFLAFVLPGLLTVLQSRRRCGRSPTRRPASCCVWAQVASLNALARSATWRTAISQSTAARGRVHTTDRGGAQRCATHRENGRARPHVPAMRHATHQHDVPTRGRVRGLQGGIAFGPALVVRQPQGIPAREAGLQVRDTGL